MSLVNDGPTSRTKLAAIATALTEAGMTAFTFRALERTDSAYVAVETRYKTLVGLSGRAFISRKELRRLSLDASVSGQIDVAGETLPPPTPSPDPIDVTDDGNDLPVAVGDGVTDDTVAIQSRINASAQGDTIYFAEGRYKVTTLTFLPNRSYSGEVGAVLAFTQPMTRPTGITIVGDLIFEAAPQYYVATTGSDSNAGTFSAPKASVSSMVSAITTGSWTTVVIKNGTYRQSADISRSGYSRNFPLTIRGETAGSVEIDGADVMSTGWTVHSGSIYKHAWAYDFFLSGSTRYRTEIGFPKGAAEQFIYNGTALEFVATLADLTSAGKFFVDWATDLVYVWLPGNVSPNSSSMLGSTRAFGIRSTNSAKFVSLVDLNVTHGANFQQGSRALVQVSTGWTVSNCVVDMASGTGIGHQASGLRDIVFYRVTAQNCGQMGINGTTNLKMHRCHVYRNNYKQIADWEYGGAKLAGCDGATITNYEGNENYGHALWFDINNVHCTVANSQFHHNKIVGSGDQSTDWINSSGLFFEISGSINGVFTIPYSRLTVTGCSFHDNEGSGLKNGESYNVYVDGNDFYDNYINMDFRSATNRGNNWFFGKMTIINNRFKNWTRNCYRNSSGAWNTPTIVNAYEVVMNNNTYAVGSTNFASLHGTTYTSLATLTSNFGWETTHTIANW